MLKFLFILTLLLSPLAHALDIEISGGGVQQIPIAIAPFAQADALRASTVHQVISNDLRRSGLFRLLETRGIANIPHEPEQVQYPVWQNLKAQALVIGKVEPSATAGRLKVSFRLLDVYKMNILTGMEYDITPSQLRQTGHKIADIIYEQLTGEPGVFSTRIAYVKKLGTRFLLVVSDADGGNPQSILSSTEPIISPDWSPDGTKLAYVSFEKKKPVIFIQSLTSGQRYTLANFKGNNSAPAWSPDGKKLAIVLTHGANSQLYLINADGTGLKPLTTSRAIDTEPDWSPDGKWIYFTSDRGGSPQIYRISPSGGKAQRVTYNGEYNASPKLSPDGSYLTCIRRENGRFLVALHEISSGQFLVLTDSSQNESPSFAPNGRQIMYVDGLNAQNQGVLAIVSTDGRVKQKIRESGNIQEPTWGPLIK